MKVEHNFLEKKYYTLEERASVLDYGEEDQKKFNEYREYCRSFLPDRELTAADGFNHCLKMIEMATDIDWSKVKWSPLHASMVSWFSVLNKEN